MYRIPSSVALLTVLCCGVPAYADSNPVVSLSYTRDKDALVCPDEETTRRAVAARLGRQPFVAEATRALLVGIEAEGDGFAVDLKVLDAEGMIVGKRRITSDKGDCSELAAAMQLAIAIAIDPFHTMATPPPVASPPLPRPAPEVAMPQPPSTTQALGARDYIGGGLAFGITSESTPTAGIALQYMRRSESRSFGLELRIDLPSSITEASGAVETQLQAASLLYCWQRSSMAACAIASAGVLQGGGSGYATSSSFRTPYAAVGARIGRLLPLDDQMAIEVGGDFLARLNRTVLLVDTHEAWTSSPVEVSLGAKLVVKL